MSPTDPLADITAEEANLVTALDMEPGFLYQTAKTEKNKYRCKVYRKHDPLEEQVTLEFYEPQYNRTWMTAVVSLDYPVKKMGIDLHKNESRINGDGQRKPGLKLGGRISGMGMMECWGLYFRKFISVPGGRQQIIKSMIEEFPEHEERIIKWVDSYKSYYKMGKLPGCTKQEGKVNWVEDQIVKRTIINGTIYTSDPLAALEAEDGYDQEV